VKERRSLSRQKSFLQGRIYFNNRRSTVDCLIRDYSDTGARLKFSETIAVPEVIELFIPNKEEIHRARVEWRSGNEMGVSFGEEVRAPSIAPDAAQQGDLATRVQRLEAEVASLKRLVNELRSENRKQHGEVG
jgi:PilZ domain